MKKLVFGIILCVLIGCLSTQNNMKAQENEGSKEKATPAQGEKKTEDKGKQEEFKGEKGMKYPVVSPDGKTIAFSFHGDIWTVPIDGGKATRVTLHEAHEIKPIWSPDSQKLAFSSNRSGNYDIWIVDADGGVPEQLTFSSAGDIVVDWAKDGKWILFESTRTTKFNLWKINIDGGSPVQITKDMARLGSLSPDGSKVAFMRGTFDLSVRDYKGPGNWDIYVSDINGGVPKQLTTFEGNDFTPKWLNDKEIIFNRDSAHKWEVWKLNIETQKEEKLYAIDDDIINPELTPDKKFIVYESKFYFFKKELNSDKKPVQIPVEIKSDSKGYAYIKHFFSSGARNVDLSKDGTRMVFSLGGDIWLSNSSGGNSRRLTSGPSTDDWPRFSPSGTWVSFYSNRSGNLDIWAVSVANGKLVQITNHPSDDFFQAWSPDGKNIVFSSERSGNRDIWVIPVNGGNAVQLTNYPTGEDDPSYSADGKYIAFDSNQTGTSCIWIMDSNGANKRRITDTQGVDQCPRFSPDGKLIAYEARVGAYPEIRVVSVNGGQTMTLLNKAEIPCWAPNGYYIYFHTSEEDTDGNGVIDKESKIFRVDAPRNVIVGQEVPIIAEYETTKQKEMEQIFEEAWMNLNDYFYDPNFHGIDWKEMKTKYKEICMKAETKEELYYFISKMIGELSASHLGIYGAGSNRKGLDSAIVGFELNVPKDETIDALQVMNVIPNGPADKAWIRPGDYIFEIDGVKVNKDVNYFKLLLGKVNKIITFKVATKQDLSDERIVKVKPFDYMGIYKLLKQNWINKCEDTVKKQGNDRVAYVYIPDMMEEGLSIFKSAVSRYKDKDALIIDVRGNGGGRVHQQILDILSRKVIGKNKPRGGKDLNPTALVWDKPVVLLINEKSFSNAEIFAWSFKYMKRGPVVGVPTAGGVIGTVDIKLSDGSTFRIPRIGWYRPDGVNMEKHPVEPDVFVPLTPEDRINGNDPQLKKAIELLNEELKKNENKNSEDKENNKPKNNEQTNK